MPIMKKRRERRQERKFTFNTDHRKQVEALPSIPDER
jgi:hypothetical protein